MLIYAEHIQHVHMVFVGGSRYLYVQSTIRSRTLAPAQGPGHKQAVEHNQHIEAVMYAFEHDEISSQSLDRVP